MVGPTIPSRVLVVGLGRSGLAAARLAVEDGSEVVVTDRRPEAELVDVVGSLPGGVRAFLGGHPEASLEGVDLVVASPGVPPTAPILEAARARGVAVAAEVEFAWRHRREAPLVAVTGSNGKSTVTELVARMLSDGGLAVAAGGNLGTAASQLVLEGGWECWVLEISSFQAELLTAMSPRVAVFLNLSQDHLERHPDLASYLQAKQRLFAFQQAEDTAVLNADDRAVATTATRAQRQLFSLVDRADGWVEDGRLMIGDEVLLPIAEMALCGTHNVANALAAALAASVLEVPARSMAASLRGFQGLAHRHRTIHEAAGVRWVDDSKATNVGATLAALRGYPDRSVHLILGGLAKGQDFSALVSEVRRAAACVYLIGEDGPAIGEALAGAAPVEDCKDLATAVSRARQASGRGQWVLLAPACASFDQFTDYAERGDRFTELAREEAVACP